MELNPRWAMLDVKMFLYLVGAVMLSLNVLSAAALQAEQDGARDADLRGLLRLVFSIPFVRGALLEQK
jgi:hypothetical protein